MEILDKINNAEAICIYFKGNNCTTCDILFPKVENLIKASFPKIDFLAIDAPTNEKITAHYQVFSVPTIIVFFGGQETIRKGRHLSIPEFQHEIERYYDLYFA